jgi:SAM-dependent methyltransferase
VRGRGLWYRAWRWRAAQKAAANRLVSGEVERPLPGQRFLHVLDVGGWARARQGEPARVRVEVNGQIVAEGESTLSRQPAGAPLPENEAAHGHARAGFQFLVSNSQLPQGKLLWLTVKAAASSAPDRWETLQSIPVRRGKGWIAAPPRDAYARVWDQSSTSIRHARLSVAGYDDEAEWRRTGVASAEYMARACEIGPRDTVLEIGCGAARVGVHLAPRCGQWIGADVSRNMLGHAQEALRAAGAGNVRFVPLNGYDLEGVADASVDAVYCTAVFMHLEEWDRYRYVREAFRVLRPGGRVYFDNFNLLTDEGWALFDETARLDVAVRPPNVSKSSTPPELHCYAQRAGFDDIAIDTGGLWVAVRARKP